MSKTVYIVMGPTAVGKTNFAIALAKALNTEIIREAYICICVCVLIYEYIYMCVYIYI